MKEGQTFQAFELVTELEWSVDGGYRAVWVRTGVTFIIEKQIIHNEHNFI